jgi:hypothetical protein
VLRLHQQMQLTGVNYLALTILLWALETVDI